MTFEVLHDILRWATLINIGILILWGVMIMAAGNFVYRMHSRIFPMSQEQFYQIHYAGLVFAKLVIVVFNLVPLLAMYIVG